MSHIEQSDIENVMVVAGQLFAEKGYEGVGIREIAAKSGIKVSAILYHFGSKASLYEDVLDYKYRAVMESVAAEIRHLSDPQQKIEYFVGAIFDLLYRDRVMLLLLQRDIAEVVAEGVSPKRRPGFVSEYYNFISLTGPLLEAALGRPMEKGAAVAMTSLMMGFCVITAASGERNMSRQEHDAWYAEQRAELITFGKRICQV